MANALYRGDCSLTLGCAKRTVQLSMSDSIHDGSLRSVLLANNADSEADFAIDFQACQWLILFNECLWLLCGNTAYHNDT
jgi:hypothetical protein